jgi:hypothetical protein
VLLGSTCSTYHCSRKKKKHGICMRISKCICCICCSLWEPDSPDSFHLVKLSYANTVLYSMAFSRSINLCLVRSTHIYHIFPSITRTLCIPRTQYFLVLMNLMYRYRTPENT